MGNLSEHFNNKDFACRCSECAAEYKIHLGLVGALEQIGSYYRKRVDIVSAYWCDAFHEKLNKQKRSFHTKGKAVHIKVEGVAPQELFKFCETIPELKGLVFYPKEEFIHVDTRPGEPAKLVKEGNDYHALTPEKRARYGIQ